MDDYTLTFNQVGTLLRLSPRYISGLIKGEPPQLDSAKRVNQEKGRSMRYFRPSSVINYAKLHGVRIRAEDVQNEIKDQDVVRMFAEVSSEQEMNKTEQGKNDSYVEQKSAGSEQNGEIMGLFKSSYESLQKQLDTKDKTIDQQQQTIFELMRRQGEALQLLKDSQEELRHVKMLAAPKQEEATDQQKLPLETVVHETDNRPDFILQPEEEKPKRKIKVGIWPFRKTIEI